MAVIGVLVASVMDGTLAAGTEANDGMLRASDGTDTVGESGSIAGVWTDATLKLAIGGLDVDAVVTESGGSASEANGKAGDAKG